MRVAVLGLGRMGAAIAERLHGAGHELSVWNRSPAALRPFLELGVGALASPAEALSTAEVAITMLADDDALEAVTSGERGLLAAGGAGGAGGTLIDMSTVSAAVSARVAAAAERAGVEYLRAPVSGNPGVVRAGNLSIIVSGSQAEFERLRELLHDIGPNLAYVGPAEQARVVKLALNLMLAGTAELIAEALVLAEKHGVARAQMLEVMGGSAVGSPFVHYKTPALVADDYDSTFSARQLYKDLALALQAGNEVAAPLPLVGLIQQLVQGCIAGGMGDRDFMALLPRLRREAGLDQAPV